MHSKTLLHRDIKLSNFLIGTGENKNLVHLIDFGLAVRYFNPQTQTHIPFKSGKKLTGTTRYVSINTHLGMEQSRRDDLESLGYVLVYLAQGSLPWLTITAETKEKKHAKIKELKMGISASKLCKGLPTVFVKYLTYCQNLKFTQPPDYERIKKMFNDSLVLIGETCDNQFDWLMDKDSLKKLKLPGNKIIIFRTHRRMQRRM